MSDLCMDEFGDIVWDEFCRSEDHIVPHPINEEVSEHSFLDDSRKRPRHEVIGVLGDAREQSTNKSICQEKDQQNILVLGSRRDIMREKDSWPCTPNGVFRSSCDSDSVKEVSGAASDGTRTPTHCFKGNNTDLIGNGFCTSDSILTDESAAVDSNSYDYSLGPIPQTDNDLNLFDNDCTNKDSSDFLCYDWPDIENFDDVDRMFRSCDSTFGLGASKEDDLRWFSSSDDIEGSRDVLKSEFKISCPALATMAENSENYGPIRTNETCCPINDSNLICASISYKDDSRLSDKDETDTLGHLPHVNGTSSSDSKDDFMPRKQGIKLNSGGQQKVSAIELSATGNSGLTNVHKKQQGQYNQFEAKRKEPYGGSIYYSGTNKTEDKKLPPMTSQQTISPGGIQQEEQAMGPETFGYLQNNITNTQSDYSYPSDQTSNFQAPSKVNSKNGFTNISPKESYSTNQVLSAESSHAPAFQVTSAVASENREKPDYQQASQSSFNNKTEDVEMGVQVPLCDLVSVGKKVQPSGRKLGNHANVEGVPGELGCSNVQDSSSVSSDSDETSLEAAIIRQLQHVMEQLDLRTKLCIRNGLYRLAQSADQRHNYANLKGSYCGDDTDANGVLVAGNTDRHTGFLDMETDTNPIDRSIAHLLFHRSSESSMTPAQDIVSFKSPTPIHVSVSDQPLTPEKSVNDGAVAAETDGNAA